MTKDGPAFPTLRQWYAGLAMQGLLSDRNTIQAIKVESKDTGHTVYQAIAVLAYACAHAMLSQGELEDK